MAQRPLLARDPPGLAAVHRPPAGDILLMVVAAAAVSTSGPLIAAAAAPALAVAFWRNALATGVLLPVATLRNRQEIRAMDRRRWLLALAAGALLAAHFATWIPSVTMSSVASATALVCAQPVWAGLLARVLGHRIPVRAWFGIGLSLAGVVMLTGVDLSVSGRAVAGDLLAVAGGALAAGYVTVGAQVRRHVSTTGYTVVCYGTATVLLFLLCVAGGQRLGGYDGGTWLKLVAITAGPQLLGHSLFNRVLRTTSPTVVSLVSLFEVPGAAVIAALWLGQRMPLLAVPAAVALVAGVAVVITARGPDAPTPPDVPG
jgi:drug/metabolite transporter (DMT)-like permease